MYKILEKMKKKFKYDEWLKLLEQAREYGKISENEYVQLTKES